MEQDGQEFSQIGEGKTDALLQKAAKGELVLYAFVRRHSATLHATPFATIKRQGSRITAAQLVPVTVELARTLLGFTDASLDSYLAADPTIYPETHPYTGHLWVLDAPQTVTREQIYFRCDDENVTAANVHGAKVAAVKQGLTKGAVISAFGGMHFDNDKWNKYLGDPPQWLKECRLTKGSKKVSATWNPVLIAAALFDKEISISKLDAVFVRLNDWADEWSEASDTFRN